MRKSRIWNLLKIKKDTPYFKPGILSVPWPIFWLFLFVMELIVFLPVYVIKINIPIFLNDFESRGGAFFMLAVAIAALPTVIGIQLEILKVIKDRFFRR